MSSVGCDGGAVVYPEMSYEDGIVLLRHIARVSWYFNCKQDDGGGNCRQAGVVKSTAAGPLDE